MFATNFYQSNVVARAMMLQYCMNLYGHANN